MILSNPGLSGRKRKLSPIVRQLGYTGSPLPLDEWSKLRRIIASTLGEDGANAVLLPPVTLSCATCSKTFEREAFEVKKHQRRGLTEFYCSDVCACRGHNLKRFGDRVCARCGAPAPKLLAFGARHSGRIYCSQDCMKAVQEEEQAARALARLIPCERCQTMFSPHHAGTRFCSIPCKNEAHSETMQKRNPNWKGGVDQRRKLGVHQKSFRRVYGVVLARDGYQCLLCLKESQLHVHHINEVNVDNRLTNLATVCKLCHNALHFSEARVMLSSRLRILVEKRMSTTFKLSELGAFLPMES
jgi:hypothetical protein